MSFTLSSSDTLLILSDKLHTELKQLVDARQAVGNLHFTAELEDLKAWYIKK